LPHGICTRALHDDGTNPCDARERIRDVNVGVIRQELCISGALGSVERNDHQRADVGFCDGHPLVPDRGRELRQRAIDTDLGKYLRDIGVYVQIEIDTQFHGSVIRVERPHVQHAFHAGHRFFNWGRNGALDGQCVGADIVCGDDDFRRSNIRELSDRKALREHDCDDNNQKRNYDRGDGPIDEES
jgi:hypothetical protein